jgi:hypothetical protein
MNGLPDPLSALRDIHLPADPGWWPPAPGWWLLLIVLVAGIPVLLPRFRGYLHSRRLLRLLERRFGAMPLDGNGESRLRSLREMSLLARRYAITRFGRRRVAGLCGNDWLEFLDSTSGTREFTRGAGRLLAAGPYQSVANSIGPDRLEALRRSLLNWARECHRQRGMAS